MNSSPPARRPRAVVLRLDALEPRSLLTGGLGNTFAVINGSIPFAGGSASTNFTISTPQFTIPRGQMVLGIQPVLTGGAPFTPQVTGLTDPHGNAIHYAAQTITTPGVEPKLVTAGVGQGPVVTPIIQYPHQPNRPATYSLTLTPQNQQAVDYSLQFYLPGDANGDGRVDGSDLALIRADQGSVAGTPSYNLSADANRDGVINRLDLQYALKNLGVATTVLPILTTNIDPATVSDPAAAITNVPDVVYYGRATPGAAITFTEANNKTPAVATTADNNGSYSATIPLALGENDFTVESQDAFGQDITGAVAPITYDPNAPGAASPFAAPIAAASAPIRAAIRRH